MSIHSQAPDVKPGMTENMQGLKLFRISADLPESEGQGER